MTELLEKAFQKVTAELSEKEQNVLAQIILESDSRIFINEAKRLFRHRKDYNEETQQAMKNSIEKGDLTEYKNSDDLFQSLEI